MSENTAQITRILHGIFKHGHRVILSVSEESRYPAVEILRWRSEWHRGRFVSPHLMSWLHSM